MLRKETRLRRPGLFRRACSEGERFANRGVVLYVRPVKGSVKIGVAAGKRLGGAVVRNRLKRRFREAVRALVPRIQGEVHVVLVVRAGAKRMAFEEIKMQVEKVLDRAGLLVGGGEA